MARFIPKIIAVLAAAGALQAQALQITGLSPQGEIPEIRQIVAKFDAPAVNFGDSKAPAPLHLNCTAAAKGARAAGSASANGRLIWKTTCRRA